MAFCAKCGKELPAGATFCPACGASVSGASAPSAPMSGMDSLLKEPAAQGHWLRRIVALIIDAIIIGIVVVVIAAVGIVGSFASGGALGFFFGVTTILAGILLILYFPIMESTRGASIGKQAMGLKVVSKTGTNPTFGEAFVRNISKIYWLLLLLDVVIGLAVSKGYSQNLR